MPNYSEDEDYSIAVAYINVTVDPIRGVGQKGENFGRDLIDFACCSKKSLLNLANTFRCKPKYYLFDSLLVSFVFNKTKMIEKRNIVVDY